MKLLPLVNEEGVSHRLAIEYQEVKNQGIITHNLREQNIAVVTLSSGGKCAVGDVVALPTNLPVHTIQGRMLIMEHDVLAKIVNDKIEPVS